MKSRIITALDIGSAFIKIVSVTPKKGGDGLEVLSQRQEASAGVRKGVVVDIQRASEIIYSLVRRAEEDCGKKIEGVCASIGGGHIQSSFSRGLVSVSRADKKISEEDIERVLEAAETFPLPSNKEIIKTFAREYIVDEGPKVKDALGMEGVRLEADVVAIHGFSPYIKNTGQAILSAGFQVEDTIPASLASSRAVLSNREKELGVCVIDIGAGTMGLAVFEEGGLSHLSVFPVGSANITSDIAICLKTDIDTAERIKLEYGSCKLASQSGAGLRKKIRVEPAIPDDFDSKAEPIIFTKKTLSEIIEARVAEIFSIANKELKRISKQRLLPGGIVLTGGGAKLPGMKDLAKREFKLPVRIGASQNSDFKDDLSFSACYGLITEAMELEEPEESHFAGTSQKIKTGFKKFFRIFMP